MEMAPATLRKSCIEMVTETDKTTYPEDMSDEEDIFIVDSDEDLVPSSPPREMQELSRRRTETASTGLSRSDFDFLRTLGTGTFARVWLVRPAHATNHPSEKKLFALKVLKKIDVIRLKQVEHVANEREILAAVAGHPFITTLVTNFADRDSLYMLLDFCPGGEVFGYLRRARHFDLKTTRFYAAEIVLVLEFLHEREGIAYRDLKPENIMLDEDGHVKLVDFGFAKRIGTMETYTLCGTPEYLSPEVIQSKGHGTAVDWWALGILIYEFLVGYPPFYDNHVFTIYEKIIEGRIRFPTWMTRESRSLIGGLCTADRSSRLGNMAGGASQVKAHPFFEGIDWDALYRREEDGPIIPHLRFIGDTRYFDQYDPETTGGPQYTDDLYEKYEDTFKDF